MARWSRTRKSIVSSSLSFVLLALLLILVLVVPMYEVASRYHLKTTEDHGDVRFAFKEVLAGGAVGWMLDV